MTSLGRVAFLGTGAFGVPLLEQLAGRAGALLIVSQPDRPAGRGLHQRPSPVAEWGRANGHDVVTPRRIRSDEGRGVLREFAPDGLLLAAYGQLIPREVLAIAPRAPLNVHPSLLPRHRGAAPVASTILAGDPVAGVSLMVMTDEIDAGPVVAQWPVPLTGRESTPELEQRLAQVAAERVPPLLDAWVAGQLAATAQDDSSATLIRPFRRADGWIDWHRNADEIDRQVRALQPWPGAWTTLAGRRLHVRAAHPVAGVSDVPIAALIPGPEPRVACGQGALVLDMVQAEGRPAMPGPDWRRGLQRDHVLLGAPVAE